VRACPCAAIDVRLYDHVTDTQLTDRLRVMAMPSYDFGRP
jgi:hypothetical protein